MNTSKIIKGVVGGGRYTVTAPIVNADFWSCKYVNVWADMNVQPTYDGFDYFFYDATHANFLGMERIGQIMLNAVKAYVRGG